MTTFGTSILLFHKKNSNCHFICIYALGTSELLYWTCNSNCPFSYFSSVTKHSFNEFTIVDTGRVITGNY